MLGTSLDIIVVPCSSRCLSGGDVSLCKRPCLTGAGSSNAFRLRSKRCSRANKCEKFAPDLDFYRLNPAIFFVGAQILETLCSPLSVRGFLATARSRQMVCPLSRSSITLFESWHIAQPLVIVHEAIPTLRFVRCTR